MAAESGAASLWGRSGAGAMQRWRGVRRRWARLLRVSDSWEGMGLSLRRKQVPAVFCGVLLMLAACGHPGGKGAANKSRTSAAAATYASLLAASTKAATGNTGALCGFPLKPCDPATLGKVSAQQPKAGTVGNFVEVDLTKFFQSDAIIPPVKVSPPPKTGPAYKGVGKYKLAGAGNGLSVGSVPVPFAPNTGTWKVPITWHGQTATVPFLMPAGGTGVKDAFDIQSQVTIPVPAGKYLGFWLLETGINGGGGPTNVAAVYKSGTVSKYGVYYQPNCNTATSLPQFWVYAAPYFLTSTGVSTTCRSLFAEAVPINPDHTLTKLVLPSNPANVNNKLVIMALTLEKAPAGGSTSSVAAGKSVAGKAASGSAAGSASKAKA